MFEYIFYFLFLKLNFWYKIKLKKIIKYFQILKIFTFFFNKNSYILYKILFLKKENKKMYLNIC